MRFQAVDYLLKPVNKSELRDILEVLKKQYHQRMRNRRQECFKDLLDGIKLPQKSCIYDELLASSWYLLLIRVLGRGGAKGGLNPETQKSLESGLIKMFRMKKLFSDIGWCRGICGGCQGQHSGHGAKALELLNVMGQSDGVIAMAGLPEPVRAQDFRQHLLELRIQIMTESIYGKSCYSCGGRSCLLTTIHGNRM